MITKHPTMDTHYTDDRCGLLTPWWTRPAVEWLIGSNIGRWSVLEWGCGSSSLWFEKYARAYVGIESSLEFVVSPKILHVPVDLNLAPDAELSSGRPGYVTQAKHLGRRDLVVVDGLYRRGCCEFAPSILKRGGILVVDNANWIDDVVAGLRSRFQRYTRFIDPDHSPEWATDVYEGFIA